MIKDIKLEEGTIFEINRNTGTTYFYGDYEITAITMQEYNIINNVLPENRNKVLKEFRFNQLIGKS